MPHAIHITTLKRMLQSPEPVDLKLWTRSGEIQCCTAASLSATTSTKAREE
uniref:hypothetical protein n=1 Tax=Alloprevotella sp. TaxID=1872471 RepID=UPI003FEF14FE